LGLRDSGGGCSFGGGFATLSRDAIQVPGRPVTPRALA